MGAPCITAWLFKEKPAGIGVLLVMMILKRAVSRLMSGYGIASGVIMSPSCPETDNCATEGTVRNGSCTLTFHLGKKPGMGWQVN